MKISCNPPQRIKAVCILLVGIVPGLLRGQIFNDDFESYAAGQSMGWDESSAIPVADALEMDLFGSPNNSVLFLGTSQKLMKNVGASTIGMVSTFSTDFVEVSSGNPTSGLQVGYGINNDINTASGSIRVELENGLIGLNSIGGLSKTTQKGIEAYEKDTVYRLFIVVNDTESPLTDYQGDEDLAAGSFEVWLYSKFDGLQHVMEATIARDPEYAGFRTWSSYDAAFYVDNVWIEEGAVLDVAAKPSCGLTTALPGVLSGNPILLEYSVPEELAPGSTYLVTADAPAQFTNGATGNAEASGQIEAIVTAPDDTEVSFTLIIRDEEGNEICVSRQKVMVFNYSETDLMVHPSIPSTEAQLKLMKELVLNDPDSLAKAGWDAMQDTSYASLTWIHSPQVTVTVVPSGTSASENAFRKDSVAARAHALQWVVTGDPAHRDKALEILNDWGHAYRTMVSTGSFAQTYLESAWALPVWLSAADIMRYYDNGVAGWDPVDMAAFHHFAKSLYERSRGALNRENNWGSSAAFAVMAYGAWIGNPEIFQEGLESQIEKLGSFSETDGEIVEVCRDTWHPQYTVVTWGDAAELAHNQGMDDLYEARFDGQDTPRLAIVLEYFSNLMLGNTAAPCEEGWSFDYLGEYRRFDNYEVPYNHYIGRKMVDYLPVFQEMVEDFWRADVGDDAHFLLWSRLTHGGNLAENSSPGKGLLSDYPADINRWIDTGGWLGWINDSEYPWLYHFGIGYFYLADATDAGSWIYVPF